MLWIAKGNGGPWKIDIRQDRTGARLACGLRSRCRRRSFKRRPGSPTAGKVGKTYKYSVMSATRSLRKDDPDVDIE